MVVCTSLLIKEEYIAVVHSALHDCSGMTPKYLQKGGWYSVHMRLHGYITLCPRKGQIPLVPHNIYHHRHAIRQMP